MYLHLSWACYLRKFRQTGSWQESCHLRLLYCALFLLISAVYSKCSLVVSIAKKKSINSHFTVHIYVPVTSDVNWAKILGFRTAFCLILAPKWKKKSLSFPLAIGISWLYRQHIFSSLVMFFCGPQSGKEQISHTFFHAQWARSMTDLNQWHIHFHSWISGPLCDAQEKKIFLDTLGQIS